MDARGSRQAGRGRSRRINDRTAGNFAPVGEGKSADLPSFPLQADHSRFPVLGALTLRRLAEGPQQGVGIEPTFAGQTQGTRNNAVGCKPGKACVQGCGVEIGNLCATLRLEGVIVPQDRHAGVARQQKVTAVAKIHPGVFAQVVGDVLGEGVTELRDSDVDLGRKLLPDRSCGTRRRTVPVREILLQHKYAPRK